MPVLLPSSLQAVIGSPIRVPRGEPEFTSDSSLCSGEIYFPPEESYSDPCSEECDVPGYPGLTLAYWFDTVITESELKVALTVVLSVGHGSKRKPFLLTTHSFRRELIDPDHLASLRSSLEGSAGYPFETSQWISNNPFGPDPVRCGEIVLTNPEPVYSQHIQAFARYVASQANEDWQSYQQQPYTWCDPCEAQTQVKCASGEDQFSYSINGRFIFGNSEPDNFSYSGAFSPWYKLPCADIAGYHEDLAEQIISRDYSGSLLEQIQQRGWQIFTGPPQFISTDLDGDDIIIQFSDTVQATYVDENGDDVTTSEEVTIIITISVTCNCDNDAQDPPDPDNPWGDPNQPCAGEPQWKVYCPSGMHFYGHFEAMIRKKDDPEETYRWRLTSSPKEITVAGGCLGVPWGLLREDYAWIRGPGSNSESGHKAGLYLSASTDLVNWSPPSTAFQDPIWWGFYYYVLTEARLVGTLDPEWEWVGTPYGTFQPGYLHGITTIKYLDCNDSVVGWDINSEDVSNPTSDQPVLPPDAPPPPGIPCKQYIVLAKISMGIGSHLKKKFLEEVEDAIRAKARRAGKLIGQSRSPIDQQIWDAFEFIVDRVVDALSLSVTLASYQIPLICTWYEASELELFLLNQLIDILVSWPSATITAPLSIKLSAEVEVLPEECECQPP